MARIKHLTKDQQATLLETLPQIPPLRRRLHPPKTKNPRLDRFLTSRHRLITPELEGPRGRRQSSKTNR